MKNPAGCVLVSGTFFHMATCRILHPDWTIRPAMSLGSLTTTNLCDRHGNHQLDSAPFFSVPHLHMSHIVQGAIRVISGRRGGGACWGHVDSMSHQALCYTRAVGRSRFTASPHLFSTPLKPLKDVFVIPVEKQKTQIFTRKKFQLFLCDLFIWWDCSECQGFLFKILRLLIFFLCTNEYSQSR